MIPPSQHLDDALRTDQESETVDFKTSLLTSLINCGGAVIVSLVIGIPAAYAAGRWKYKGSNDLMFQMLSLIHEPPTSLTWLAMLRS